MHGTRVQYEISYGFAAILVETKHSRLQITKVQQYMQNSNGMGHTSEHKDASVWYACSSISKLVSAMSHVTIYFDQRNQH